MTLRWISPDTAPNSTATPISTTETRAVADPWIVAGLGNPGDRYARTRHNAGTMVVDRLAERLPSWHDDRALPVCERDHDRADACMRDDRARPPDRLDHPLEWQKVDDLGARNDD